MVSGVTKVRDKNGGKERNRPDDFEEAELETVAALCADAEVWKDKEAGVLVVVLWILEMVKAGDDRACCTARAAVLEPVKLCVIVWLCEGGEHEVVGILEEGVGGIGVGMEIWLVRGIEDPKLDDGWRIDGTAVGCD